MARQKGRVKRARTTQQTPRILRPYQYQPLDPTSKQVRLLDLYPASNLGDRLEGRLVTASLGDRPVSNALSYMWGDPAPEDVIYIRGRLLHISKNLGRALRHIRHHDQGRKLYPLWADGVCIDQQTIKERNHQVGQMGSIYRLAHCVCVWIDEYTDDRTVTFRHLSESRWRADSPELSLAYPEMQYWKDLIPLFQNPY